MWQRDMKGAHAIGKKLCQKPTWGKFATKF